jgi:hypothetical protein
MIPMGTSLTLKDRMRRMNRKTSVPLFLQSGGQRDHPPGPRNRPPFQPVKTRSCRQQAQELAAGDWDAQVPQGSLGPWKPARKSARRGGAPFFLPFGPWTGALVCRNSALCPSFGEIPNSLRVQKHLSKTQPISAWSALGNILPSNFKSRCITPEGSARAVTPY